MAREVLYEAVVYEGMEVQSYGSSCFYIDVLVILGNPSRSGQRSSRSLVQLYKLNAAELYQGWGFGPGWGKWGQTTVKE